MADMQTSEVPAALSAIRALVGAREFKALCEECAAVAPEIRRHKTFSAFSHRSYLFAINAGNGLSTCLALFARLLEELGIFRFAEDDPVAEICLPAPDAKIGADELFAQVRPHLCSFGQEGGKLLCIDISEWMTQPDSRAFRGFLARLEDHLEELQIVFRVPFVEKSILDDIKKSLRDLLYVTDVTFAPLAPEELLSCAETALEKYGFTMDADARRVFEIRVSEEKSDGRFYGINTVHKIVCEMIYLKHLYSARSGRTDTRIFGSEITALAESYDATARDGVALLDDYVGMETVKARLLAIVAQIEAALQNSSIEPPCIHMRFVGNPGTGKTTAARILGRILKERGVLRNGNFFEYSGRDLCGRFVGETAPKTAGMCRDAYGSVLFIDEAYSLYTDEDGARNDFGREALDTLIAEMENHRSDLVVIMAGYPDEMETLMRGNAGLESRMPYVIEFPNYTREQLFRIFMRMADKSFSYDEGFADAARAYFDALPEAFITAKTFSNARFVRNLFERTWGKAVMRTQLAEGEALCLRKEDLLAAGADREFQKIAEKKSRPMGFFV